MFTSPLRLLDLAYCCTFAGVCPAQVASELRRKLPRILGPHSLRMYWAYKYSSEVPHGISIHGDQAAVNLNMWPVSLKTVAPPPFDNAKMWRKFIFTCSPGTGCT